MTDFIGEYPHEPTPNHTTPSSPPPPTNPSRRPLRVLLLGDKQDVTATIKNLHKRGFAEAGEWSKPIAIPSPNSHDSLPAMPPGSVMSILTKYLNQD